MSILVWNARGFNEPSRAREAVRLLQEKHCNLFDLVETKVKIGNRGKFVEGLGNKWNWFDNYEFDPSGRIAIGWNPGISKVQKWKKAIR